MIKELSSHMPSLGELRDKVDELVEAVNGVRASDVCSAWENQPALGTEGSPIEGKCTYCAHQTDSWDCAAECSPMYPYGKKDKEANTLYSCPFCGEGGFDLKCLKNHLVDKFCGVFDSIPSLTSEDFKNSTKVIKGPMGGMADEEAEAIPRRPDCICSGHIVEAFGHFWTCPKHGRVQVARI